MDRLVDLRIAEVLAVTASTAPAPGAGAAGALALAFGIACLRKAVRMSAKHQPDDAALADADARLAALGEGAATGADRDARGFEALIAALQRPHEEAGAAAARTAAVRAAARDLVAVAEDLLALGDALRRDAEALRPRLDPVMRNDVDAALALEEAGRRIQAANLAENRRHLD